MTISYVDNAGGGGSELENFVDTDGDPITTQDGDLVFYNVKYEVAAGLLTVTMSDSEGGNTYNERVSVAHSNGDLWQHAGSCVLTNGGANHVFTASLSGNARYRALQIDVWRQDASGWVYVGTNSAQGTGTSMSAGNLSPSAGYAAFACFAPYGSGAFTNGSGWTTRRTGPEFNEVAGTGVTAYIESRSNTSGETITGDGTRVGSVDWCAAVIAFTENNWSPQQNAPETIRLITSLRW